MSDQTSTYDSTLILIILNIIITVLTSITTIALTFIKMVRRSSCCGGDIIMRTASEVTRLDVQTEEVKNNITIPNK